MLSNFQFGNQALLQSFLVGQPEFREILQQPEMEQFRQRVAATCHIGPMDVDETRGYIEHRLKCAGSTGKPSFDTEAFPAIFEATKGIPRRINAVCDRLLLTGFLAGRTQLTAVDVGEVVNEFEQESAAPKRAGSAAATRARRGEPAMPGGMAGAQMELDADQRLNLDLDLDRLVLDSDAAAGMQRQINELTADQRGDQLQRLERGLLRLERINVQTLSMLKQLVQAVTKAPDGDKKNE